MPGVAHWKSDDLVFVQWEQERPDILAQERLAH